MLDRFGAAILDMPLRGRDVFSILHAERVVNAFQERAGAKSVIEWEIKNEDDAELLNRIEKAVNDHADS